MTQDRTPAKKTPAKKMPAAKKWPAKKAQPAPPPLQVVTPLGGVQPFGRQRTARDDKGHSVWIDDEGVGLSWYDDKKIPGDRVTLERFATVPAPKTVAEFVDVALAIGDATFDVGGWRGQANAQWSVQTGAARRLLGGQWTGKGSEDLRRASEKMRADDPEFADWFEEARQQIEAEEGNPAQRYFMSYYTDQLLEHARSEGHDYLGGRRLSELETLAQLQHHGAATVLLDVTRNALTALWFASEQLPHEWGVVIAFDTSRLGRLSVAGARKPIRTIRERVDGDVWYWTPGASNERMRAQQAVFLVAHRIGEEPWGVIPMTGTHVWRSEFEANGWKDGDVRVFFIAVSPELKRRVLKASHDGVLGLDASSLYPDLTGFSQFHAATNKDLPWS